MEPIYSKTGSRRITVVDRFAEIDAECIEVQTAATFTSLSEDGFNTGGTGTPVAQVDTIVLSGTSGTANITYRGITRLATWNTSLTQTATDFVTAHAAAYRAVGVTVTSSGGSILFTAAFPGFPLIGAPEIVNVTTNLAGTVSTTTANVTTPLGIHGLSGSIPVGTRIFAKTRFKGVQISAGVLLVY